MNILPRITMFVFFGVCVLVVSVSSELGTTKLLPLPEKTDYKATGVSYDDGGMGPLFDFARSFINTALPGGFPKEFMNETMSDFKSGNFDMIGTGKKLLNMFLGYVIAIGVGIIFMLIFPIVGCFFCCCRLFGKCGGKRHQDITENTNCHRRAFACVMFFITIFTLVGNICTYVSNDRMTGALDEIGDTVANNLDDVDDYLDLVMRQVEVIGVHNLQLTKTDILSHMDATNLSSEISGYVLQSLSGGAFDKMEKHIKETTDAFQTVLNATQDVHKAFTTFRQQCSLVPGLCLSLQTDPLNSNQEYRDMVGNRADAFQNFAKNDAVSKVKKQLADKLDLKLATSATSIAGQRQNIEDAFVKMGQQVHDIVEEIKEFRSNAKSGIDIQSLKQMSRDYTKTAKDYDNYRHAGGAALGAITTLVITLQLLGLTFGSIGHTNVPTERGCVSNSGGNMLIASVVFVFLFASLLMLLTTVCFALGSVLERFVCQPLSDPDLQFLKVTEDYFSTKDMFDAQLTDVMKSCREGKSAYSSFKLKFDVNQLDTMLKQQETAINQNLNDILVNLNNVSPISTFTSTADHSLLDMHDALYGIRFTEINTMIQYSTNGIPMIGPTTEYLAAMNALKLAVGDLEKVKNNYNTWHTEFTTGLDKVSHDMGQQMTQVLGKFKDKMMDVAHEYVNSTKKSIVEDMGKCTPLWNLYNSIVVVSVCKYTVDAFNGFWFSIGWCLFFFIPGIILAVKLSKHYRRMEEKDDDESHERAPSFAYDSPMFRSNKVRDLDKTPIAQY